MQTKVTFLARQRGSIGIFYPIERTLNLPPNADNFFIISKVSEELEVNAILSIRRE